MLSYLKKMMNNAWFELAVRWFIGLVFVYASIHKIVSPAHFAKIIYGYNLFPDAAINIIAIVLPFLELFMGLSLILGIYPRSAALVISVLLLAFIVALSVNLVRGHEFDCGCFSFAEEGLTHNSGLMLVRDIFFLILNLQILFFGDSRRWCVRQSGSAIKNISP